MPVLDSEEIDNRFYYHPATPEGADRHTRLSSAYAHLARLIAHTVPDGREQALAITNLEQSKFWASAGVARDPETR